jgi:hypothetical protein
MDPEVQPLSAIQDRAMGMELEVIEIEVQLEDAEAHGLGDEVRRLEAELRAAHDQLAAIAECIPSLRHAA